MNDTATSTILNIDDNAAGRYAKSRILQRAGFRVIEGASGAEALRLVREAAPELALLDVKLPDMSGLDVCRIIKKDPSSAEIMVLQISASRVTTADRVHGLEGGADAYLTEPVDASELVATTRALLRLHSRERENRRLLEELRQKEQALRSSEAQFRASFELAGVGKAQIELPSGKYINVNQRYCEITGYSAAELLSMSPADLTYGADRTAEAPFVEAFMRGEVEEYVREKRMLRKDGQTIWVSVNAKLIRDENGRPARTVGVLVDITDRQRAQEALIESEERLRLAQPSAHLGIWDWNAQTDELVWTAEQEQVFGVSARTVKSYHDWQKLIHPDDLARVEASRAEAIRRQQPFDLEYRIRRPSGELRWIASRGRGWQDESGRVKRVLGVNIDISERKQAEEDLRHQKHLLQSITDNAPSMLFMIDLEGRVTFANPAARRLTGYTENELVGRMLHEAIHYRRPDGSYYAIGDCPMNSAVAAMQPMTNHEDAFVRKDGTLFPVRCAASPIVRDGMAIGSLIEAQDITKEKVSEAARRETEERLRSLSNAVPVLVWACRRDGWCYSVNDRWSEYTGQSSEEALGSGWLQTVHPDDWETALAKWSDAVAEGSIYETEVRYRRADGTYRWFIAKALPFRDECGAITGWFGSSLDIHDRKIAEQGLTQLAAIVTSSEDAMVSYSKNATILTWNRAAERLFGWSESEAVGQSARLIVPQNRLAESAWISETLRRGEAITQFETVRCRKDGSAIDVSLTISPLQYHDEVFGTSMTARDISDRKRIEAQREQQALLLDLSLDAIIVWRPDGGIEYWNQGAEKLYGYSAEEALAESVDTLLKTIFPVPRQEVEEQIRREGEWEGRLIHTNSGGRQITVLSRQQSIARAGGEIILEANRDITIIEEAERAASEAAAHLKAIVETAVDGIISIDERGIVVSINPAAEKVFGYEARDVIGANVTSLIPDLKLDDHSATDGKTKDGKDVSSDAEMHGRRSDGDHFPLELGISETNFADRRFFTVLLRDATARKNVEQTLVKAKEAADAASRVKSEFLANMSHEIRSPMTGIMGYAEILLARLSDSSDLDCARTIKRSGEYLMQIINDILDLAKIEAQGVELDREPIALPVFLSELYALMEVSARDKSLPLFLKYDGAIPQQVESDPKRLRQILINLLSNAIKFTDRGSVELIVRYLPADSEIEFKIIDSGIGMTQEQQEHLFHPFSQGDGSVRKLYGGTGLGLAITKRLVAALDGTIAVESAEGRGSSFRVSIPVKVNLSSGSRTPGKGELRSGISPRQNSGIADAHVLVVEDQADIRRLMRYFIERAGARVTLLESGEAAINLLANGSGDFDIVLMDIQMPRLDGFETTRRLRALGFAKPIVAVTAAAMLSDREKCLECGCDGYVTKPINPDELLIMIERHVAANATANALQQSALDSDRTARPEWTDDSGLRETRNPNQPLRVLLVDDRSVALNATSRLLEMQGYAVRTASTGHAAIRVAKEFLPALVLLDISLPDISGYEVFRRLKSNETLPTTVFVALSGHGYEELARAREAGFDDCLMKPFDIKAIEKVIAQRIDCCSP